MANVERMSKYYFDVVWRWKCDSVAVFGSGAINLKDILFDSSTSAQKCLKTAAYLENETDDVGRYGEPVVRWRQVIFVTYNENLGVYELSDGDESLAMVKMKIKPLAMWTD